jgi:hypothetical protein
MTNLSGTRKIESQHRLFEPIYNLSVIVDAIFTAIKAGKKGSKWEGLVQGLMPFRSKQFGINVILPLGKPMASVLSDRAPTQVAAWFFPINDDDPFLKQRQVEFSVKIPGRILSNLITPIYVDFFERYRPWLQTTYGTQTDTWPQLFNFARMIRNWISHHQGHVNFESPKAPPVTWHHLTYGQSDKGKRVIGGDMGFAEMIILMFELSDELDRLGCPP